MQISTSKTKVQKYGKQIRKQIRLKKKIICGLRKQISLTTRLPTTGNSIYSLM